MPARARLLLVFLFLASPSTAVLAAQPSFDCAKAGHEIEQMICNDDELAAKDRVLAEVYREAITAIEGTADGEQALDRLDAEQRGWAGGRDDCREAEDKRACALESYDRRIVELQARYGLAPSLARVRYACDDDPADEIRATFFQTEPPAARLERGAERIVAIQGMSASGARYEGPSGIVFWIKGDEAMVEWPQDSSFNCKVAE